MTELSQGYSEQQAEIIKTLGLLIIQLDDEYLETVAKATRDQASRQESLAVLHPHYPQSKNDLLRLKADALDYLSRYVKALKAIDEQRRKVEADEGSKGALYSRRKR